MTAEEAEKQQFTHQTLEQMTKTWYQNLQKSESAFNEQAAKLCDYELQVYNAIEQLEELEQRQIEQQNLQIDNLKTLDGVLAL